MKAEEAQAVAKAAAEVKTVLLALAVGLQQYRVNPSATANGKRASSGSCVHADGWVGVQANHRHKYVSHCFGLLRWLWWTVSPCGAESAKSQPLLLLGRIYSPIELIDMVAAGVLLTRSHLVVFSLLA